MQWFMGSQSQTRLTDLQDPEMCTPCSVHCGPWDLPVGLCPQQAVPETGRGHGEARGPGLAAELWAMVQWLCCVFSVRGWVQVCPGGGS